MLLGNDLCCVDGGLALPALLVPWYHGRTRFVDRSSLQLELTYGAIIHSPSQSKFGHYIRFGTAVICLLRQSACVTVQCEYYSVVTYTLQQQLSELAHLMCIAAVQPTGHAYHDNAVSLDCCLDVSSVAAR